jgi:hypothetical protein
MVNELAMDFLLYHFTDLLGQVLTSVRRHRIFIHRCDTSGAWDPGSNLLPLRH